MRSISEHGIAQSLNSGLTSVCNLYTVEPLTELFINTNPGGIFHDSKPCLTPLPTMAERYLANPQPLCHGWMISSPPTCYSVVAARGHGAPCFRSLKQKTLAIFDSCWWRLIFIVTIYQNQKLQSYFNHAVDLWVNEFLKSKCLRTFCNLLGSSGPRQFQLWNGGKP